MCLIAYRLRDQYLSFDSSELTNGTGIRAEVVERGGKLVCSSKLDVPQIDVI